MKVTVSNKFHRMLTERGMSDMQAGKIMKIFKNVIMTHYDTYRISWDSDASRYPEMIYSILWITLKKIALEFIEINCPQAWFKAMFDKKLDEILENSLIEGDENRIASAIEEYNEKIQEEVQPILDADEGERAFAISEMIRERDEEKDPE